MDVPFDAYLRQVLHIKSLQAKLFQLTMPTPQVAVPTCIAASQKRWRSGATGWICQCG